MTAMDQLKKRFKLTGGHDIQWFLGVEIVRDRAIRKMWLSQQSYISKISVLASQVPFKAPKSPMAPEELFPATDPATRDSIRLYQRKVGSILYAAIITRPDIAFACSRLSRHNMNPDATHHAAADRVLNYLRGTMTWGLELGGGNNLQIYSDASFADNKNDRRSSQGFVIRLFRGTVDWRANKQATVTTSSTEAELLAISQAAKEAMFTDRLIRELGVNTDDGVLTIQCDNQQTIRLLMSSQFKLKTALRHVDIYNHWLREQVQQRNIRVQYLPTKEMAADGLTKALPNEPFDQFRRQIGVVNIGRRLSKLNDALVDTSEVEDLLFDVRTMTINDNDNDELVFQTAPRGAI